MLARAKTQTALQTGLCLRASSLVQLQSALLSDKIATHNPLISKKVTDTLLLQCFRVVCMSDMACHVLRLSHTVMASNGNNNGDIRECGALPAPIVGLGLSQATIVKFLFSELDDIAAWLHVDRLSRVRMQRVSEFLAQRTSALHRTLVMSPEAKRLFRQRAVVRFNAASAARHGQEVDGWRCCCDLCRGWVELTDAQWAAFCEAVRRDFPWFQQVLRLEGEIAQSLKLLQHVPAETMNDICETLDVENKLQTAVQEVKTATLQRGDSVLEEFAMAVQAAAREGVEGAEGTNRAASHGDEGGDGDENDGARDDGDDSDDSADRHRR